MLEVIEKVDVEVEDEFILEVIPIRYGKVEDIYQSLQSVISGSGGGGATGGLGTQGGFNQGGFNQGGFNNSRRSGGFGRSGSGMNGGYNSGYNNSSRGLGSGFYPNQVAAPVRVTQPATSGQSKKKSSKQTAHRSSNRPVAA